MALTETEEIKIKELITAYTNAKSIMQLPSIEANLDVNNTFLEIVDSNGDSKKATISSALNGYATQSWVQQQGYLTSASSLSWSKLTGHPTTIAGYGITDALSRSGGSMTNTNLVGNLNADMLDGVHAANLVNRVVGYGDNNMDILKALHPKLSDSVAHTIRLEHNSHSMAFGWFLKDYAIERAYGGWFISDYSVPKWIGVFNGEWIDKTFAFLDSNVASATNADKVDGKHIAMMTSSQYAALATKDNDTIYIITD